MAARQRFALYLESAGPGETAAQVVRLHGAVAVAAARAEFMGRTVVGSTTAQEIEAMLGAPDVRAASAMAYVMPPRPD